MLKRGPRDPVTHPRVAAAAAARATAGARCRWHALSEFGVLWPRHSAKLQLVTLVAPPFW